MITNCFLCLKRICIDSLDGGCIFKNNTAGFGYGGAIYLQGETNGITNSIFEYNTARSRFGGAIYVETDNKNGIIVDNCIFNNNTSIDINRKQGSGGAI